MAIFLVNHNMTVGQFAALPADHNLTPPSSVIDMFMGSLGEPDGGWPKRLQKLILRGRRNLIADARARNFRRSIWKRPRPRWRRRSAVGPRRSTETLSYLMYPDVFLKFARNRQTWGDVDALPTPQFYYGMERSPPADITVELEPGKTLAIKFQTVGRSASGRYAHGLLRTEWATARGEHSRSRSGSETAHTRVKADPAKLGEIGAPIPEVVSSISP